MEENNKKIELAQRKLVSILPSLVDFYCNFASKVCEVGKENCIYYCK